MTVQTPSTLKQYNVKLQQSIEKIVFSLPQKLQGSIKYLTEGKKLRSNLMFDCAQILNLNFEKIMMPATFLEVLHSISLLHDDVIDMTKIRRNQPTINTIHSNQTAIFTGDFLLFQLLTIFSEYPEGEIKNDLIEKILELFSGEFLQDNNLTLNHDNTLDTYLEIVRKKTGALFSVSFSVPAMSQNKTEAEVSFYQECGYLFGIAYQLIDDFHDLEEDFKSDDFKHSQFTLPMLLWKKENPNDFQKYIDEKKTELSDEVKLMIKTKINSFINDKVSDLEEMGASFLKENHESTRVLKYTKDKINQLINS